jgi:hypothetical protein
MMEVSLLKRNAKSEKNRYLGFGYGSLVEPLDFGDSFPGDFTGCALLSRC